MKLTQLQGYQAASILIDEMMVAAEKKVPHSTHSVKWESASYRQGLYDGIFAAHCLIALGEHPQFNEDKIMEALNLK